MAAEPPGRESAAPRRRGIAAELMLLVAVVALPLAALSAYLLYNAAQREVTFAYDEVRDMASVAADRTGRAVADLRNAIEAIARRPLVRAVDAARCDPGLADLLPLYPQAANIIVVDLEGRIVCGAVPPPADRVLRIADEDLHRRMLADPKFRLSKPLVGRISKRWTVTAVQPVLGADGRLAGTVSISIDLLKWLSLADIAEGADTVAAVVTGGGVVIARSAEAADWIGREIGASEVHHQALAQGRGTLRAPDAQGTDRVWGFVPVPGTDWYALAGVPAGAVVGPARLRVAGSAAVLLVAVGIALLLAWSLITRMVRPLQAIRRVVRARAAGYVLHRLPEVGAREVAELAQEVNRMIDAGAQIEGELRRFRAAIDISGDAVLLIDRASLRYVDVNSSFCEMVGYTREEMLGFTPMDVFSADRETIERDYDAIIADPHSPATRIEGWYRRKDGSRIPVETRRRALRTKDGWIIVATARDITGRKEAEARIARLNRVYAVLSGINAAIVRIRDRAELLREAARIAVEAGGLQSAWLGEVDEAAGEVRLAAWHGRDEGFVEALGLRQALSLRGAEAPRIVQRAVTERRALVVNDVPNDPRVRMREESARLGIRAIAVFPLVVGERVAAVLALHAGERGYFDEQELRLLTELAGDISFALEHIEKSEQVDYLAYYDELTGLANRRLFTERLGQYLHAAGQAGAKLALVVADLERLRLVNESLGRQAGDALIRTAAARLAQGADRAELARISADHFAIVLQGVKGRSAVRRRVERLWQDCFLAPYAVGGEELKISARGGIALFPSDGMDPEALMRSAEAALRRAKQLGERQLFHAPEMTERTAEKLSLENRLRRALERDEFVLHYQPKVELDTQRLAGVEALIRWQSPDLGLVPPSQFVPLMEETGMILDAGAWALKRAVQDHRRWLDLGLEAPRVAVNVSAVQLRKQDFLVTLEEALRGGATPPGIDLEITESLVMDDVQGNIEKLKDARLLGVGVAIDDFGTGYSSLGYLAKLPVQALKIDRSFIVTMLNEPDTMTLVSTIISLAHSLKLKVIAEGVDSEEQAKFLRLLRCDQMQGFLYSRPVPFDEISARLARRRKG
jgi:PAS domain S-box-containing protein/diguanylate cyclase (GGDEF)-like protein